MIRTLPIHQTMTANFPTLCFLAAVLAARLLAAASFELGAHSTCLGTDWPERCPIVASGTRDRLQPPDGVITIHFQSLCEGVDVSGHGDYLLQAMDISYGGKGMQGTAVKPPEWTAIYNSAVEFGTPEPGTQLFNFSLVHKPTGRITDWLLLCFEITPGPWEAGMHAATDKYQLRRAGQRVRRELWAHARDIDAGVTSIEDNDVADPPQAWDTPVQPVKVLWVSRPLFCARAAVTHPWNYPALL